MVYVFIANGYEEVEALTTLTILRRANIDSKLISLSKLTVKGARDVKVCCDLNISQIAPDFGDAIILPGGYPGYENLKKCEELKNIVINANEKGILIGAICAAPTVLGDWGLLTDKKATCYPGMRDKLLCKEISNEKVVVDKNIITSQSVSTAIEFALTLVEKIKDSKVKNQVANSIYYE